LKSSVEFCSVGNVEGMRKIMKKNFMKSGGIFNILFGGFYILENFSFLIRDFLKLRQYHKH
jgi:hypothetical protein